MPIRRLDKTLTATTATVAGEDIAANSIPVKPHIQPGVLQPAVAGKDLSGTALGGSYTYGTAHTDGHSYYYTDIQGSKPIKDPRIGAHFGSQRYKTKSMQILEQETALEGARFSIYSIDGREWMRAYSTGGKIASRNWSTGHLLEWSTDCAGCYIEIVGYFNDINVIVNADTNKCDDIDVTVNGTLSVDGSTTLGGDTNASSPLAGRFVDAVSIINGGSTLSTSLGTTPAINTVRYEAKTGSSEYIALGAFELIAQDTTSTANRSKLQIPSQNVVSYGKKFTVSGTPHYNPFDGMSGAKTLTELGTYIDTATSLGMNNWQAGTSNYYKPFNGGRVVRWVASDGTIKTSVTMMPPNAQNISATASNAFSNAEVQAGTNDHTITFDTTTIANSSPLSEVAKTFVPQEFGNGAANGGDGATNADVTMLNQNGTADDIAYVMDDGLTNIVGDNTIASASGIMPNAADDYYYLTFIGTGISVNDPNGDSPGHYHPARNLPYGTHVLKSTRKSGTNAVEFQIDGISLGTQTSSTKGRCEEITFLQPKMPPVPEDACILADYMLMADYVQNTSATIGTISKGVRRIGGSRDHHYSCAGAIVSFGHGSLTQPFFWYGPGSHSGNTMAVSLPYFGTSFTSFAEDQSQTHTFTLDGSAVTKRLVCSIFLSPPTNSFKHGVSKV